MPTVSEDYRKKSPVQGSVKLVCNFTAWIGNPQEKLRTL
jgi:hypothetical protein